MDWASRKVLAWRLPNTMDAGFCVAALEEALFRYGRPEIFNTDQGSQFTSFALTSVLREDVMHLPAQLPTRPLMMPIDHDVRVGSWGGRHDSGSLR